MRRLAGIDDNRTTVRVRSCCAYCLKTDTHPKHHAENERENPHHLDCGRDRNCEICDAILRASGNRHGEALTRFLTRFTESRVAEPTGV